MPTSTSNLSTSGGNQRSRGKWRRKVSQTSASQSQSSESHLSSPVNQPVFSPPSSQGDAKHSPAFTASSKPLNSSTPNQKSSDKQKKVSVHSEDAIVFSPGLSVVTFDASLSVRETNSPDLLNTDDKELTRTSSSCSSIKQDGDECEYVDAVESIDPTQAITRQTAILVNPLSTSAVSQPQPISQTRTDTDTAFTDSRHCSISSEGFATPPGYDQTFSTPVSNNTVFSSVTGEDASLEKKSGDDEKNEGRDTLTHEDGVRDVGKTIDPNVLTDEELSKLINTPMDNSNENPVISSVKRNSKVMALPRSWTFKKSHDSDSDDDFVDSNYLQEMISKESIKAHQPGNNPHLSPPPALPPRWSTRSMSQPPPVSKDEAPPPLPPRNYCSSPLNRTEETDSLPDGVSSPDSVAQKVPAKRPNTWLYTTMKRGETGFGMEGGLGALKEYAKKEGLVSSEEFTPTVDKDIETKAFTTINDVDGRAVEHTVSPSEAVVEKKGFEATDLVIEDSDIMISEIPSSTEQNNPPSPKTNQPELVITNSKEVATIVGTSNQLSLENTLDIYDESDVCLLSPSVPEHQSASSDQQEQSRDTANEDSVKLETDPSSEHDIGSELDKTIDIGNQDTIEDDTFVLQAPDEQEFKEPSTRESDAILYQLGDAKKNIFTRIEVTGVTSPDTFQPSDGELSYNAIYADDGTLTPVERTYNPDSILRALPHKLNVPPMPPPRAQGSPRKSAEDDAGKDISEDEQSVGGESSDSDSSAIMATKRSKRDTDWLTKSMKKKSVSKGFF